MRDALQTLGWLACVVYSTIPAFWFMIHPFAERWRAQRRSPYRVLVPVWLAMWVGMALITSPWRQVALYRTDLGVDSSCAAVSFAGCISTHGPARTSARNNSAGCRKCMAEIASSGLVTEGIRARVRHPVYLAHLCEMLAWSVGTGLAVCLGTDGVRDGYRSGDDPDGGCGVGEEVWRGIHCLPK